MNEQFQSNGFVVQHLTFLDNPIGERKFRGLGAFPCWPLSELNEAVDSSLLDSCDRYLSRFDSSGLIAIQVIPDALVVMEYMQACRKLGLDCRVLLCSSLFGEPFCPGGAEIMAHSLFLGFDFASRSCDFSLVFDDLFGQPIEALTGTAKLNAFGLFATYADLNSYVCKRKEIEVEVPGMLESSEGCCEFELFECTNSFL